MGEGECTEGETSEITVTEYLGLPYRRTGLGTGDRYLSLTVVISGEVFCCLEGGKSNYGTTRGSIYGMNGCGKTADTLNSGDGVFWRFSSTVSRFFRLFESFFVRQASASLFLELVNSLDSNFFRLLCNSSLPTEPRISFSFWFTLVSLRPTWS